MDEDDIAIEEVKNLPPEGNLLSPRSSNIARARAVLADTDVESSEDFGKIDYIYMESIGGNYDPNDLPQVIIQGGGGSGAQAHTEIVNGAISDIVVLSWGKDYSQDVDDTNGGWLVPIEDNNGTGFEAYINTADGVLAPFQRWEGTSDGPIANKGSGYADIVNREGFVRVFDYDKGSGASGFVSMVDEIGGITEITIVEGGENYSLATSEIFIINSYNGFEHEGKDFKSGQLDLYQGVVKSYEILDSGSGYTLNTYLRPVRTNEFGVWAKDPDRETLSFISSGNNLAELVELGEEGLYSSNGYPDSTVYELNSTNIEVWTESNGTGGYYALTKWLDFEVNSTTGSGFQGRVVENLVVDGAIKIQLDHPGQDYLLPPQVILEGGGFLVTGAEDRRQPLQVTAGSKVLLLADTFDFDGEVKTSDFMQMGKI